MLRIYAKKLLLSKKNVQDRLHFAAEYNFIQSSLRAYDQNESRFWFYSDALVRCLRRPAEQLLQQLNMEIEE